MISKSYYKLTAHFSWINQNTRDITFLVDDNVPKSNNLSSPRETFLTWTSEHQYIPPQVPYTVKALTVPPVAEVLDFVTLRGDSPIILVANGQEIRSQGEQVLLVTGIELSPSDEYVYTLIKYNLVPSIPTPDDKGMDIKVKGDFIQKKTWPNQ
jgi:hypothetical protein